MIKFFATDVDGTMTDGGMYYTVSGDEFKKFNARDGMGIRLLRESGVKTAIITSENIEIVKRRAEKLKVDFLKMGTWAKLDFIKEFLHGFCIGLLFSTHNCKQRIFSIEHACRIHSRRQDFYRQLLAGFGFIQLNDVD